MNGTSAIFLGLAAYLLATISPGPATLAIMATSAHRGRQAGLKLSSGIFCGSIFWGLCAAFGLATVMSQFAGAFMALKIVGGLYLLWLAFKALRSAFTPQASLEAREVRSSKSYYLQGLAIHLTNPKAVLAWVAILSVGVQPGAPIWQTVAMFAGCAMLGFTVFGGYALLFSTQRAQTLYLAARRPIDAVVGVLFGAAGLKLVSDTRTAF